MKLTARNAQILLSCFIVFQSGCLSLTRLMGGRGGSIYDTTLLKTQGYSLPPGGLPSTLPASVVNDESSVVLEIRGEEPRMATIPLSPNQPLTIEELAKKANLPEELGHCNIYIMRPNGNNPPVRLDVRLNAKGKAENPANNYGIRPGDHLIVISDGRSHLERFVDQHLAND